MLPKGITEAVSPYPPTPYQSLIFYCNYPIAMERPGKGSFDKQPLSVLIGPQFSRVNIKVIEGLTAVRVDFMPGGLFRLLGVPMYQLFDSGFDMLDFFGPSMKGINERLRNTPDLEEAKNIIEDFLLDKISKLKSSIPFDSAIYMMLKSRGSMSIEETASLACLSVKQFERKCKERIGMNPKQYARILRFSKAYRMHESSPELKWIDIAYESGYYDQMHMIKDFKEFAGVNPSVIEQELRSTPLRMQREIRY